MSMNKLKLDFLTFVVIDETFIKRSVLSMYLFFCGKGIVDLSHFLQ